MKNGVDLGQSPWHRRRSCWLELVLLCCQPLRSLSFLPFLPTEVFDPEKQREAGISKSNKKSLRSRQH